MTILDVTEIDSELASRTAELADLSTTLMELDNHPGLEQLKRYPSTGITAQRWAAVETTLGELWNDLLAATSTLESARTLRGHRSKVGDDTRIELTRLISTELGDRLDRIRAGCPEVRDFFDVVDEINTMVATGLAPSLKRIDGVGAAVPKEVTDLLAVSATDPLSLTSDDIERRIAVIAELATSQANWPEAMTAVGMQLDALRDVVRQAAKTRASAEQAVLAGPLPVPAYIEPELRAELESMTTPDATALRGLQHRIESALRLVEQNNELAQGLIDRRNELLGRLRAYEAKAARLGLAEDAEVLSSGRIAAGLLSRRPCDLRAVTRAVADYQQLLTDKRVTR